MMSNLPLVKHLDPGAAVVGPVAADRADEADVGAGGARGLLRELHDGAVAAPAIEVKLPRVPYRSR